MTAFSDKLRSLAGLDFNDSDSAVRDIDWMQDILLLAAIQVEDQDNQIILLRQQVADLQALYDPFLRHFMRVSETDYKPQEGNGA